MNTERNFVAPGELDVVVAAVPVERRMHDRRVAPTKEQTQIADIKAAVTNYYLDLDARKHGGVAMDFAFAKIERILDMSWSDHKQALKG